MLGGARRRVRDKEPTGWLEFFGVDPSARERHRAQAHRALLVSFKRRGAHVARTMMRTQDAEIARFVAAMGFVAPVARWRSGWLIARRAVFARANGSVQRVT
jgi:hypothetical protein